MYIASEKLTIRSIQSSYSDTSEATVAHRQLLERISRFPSEPKILLLEPYYPPEAAWGSVKVEQGYLPPLGTLSIYRWLKEKRYDVDFIDTQFGDFTEETLCALLKDKQYDLVGLPLFTSTADYVFSTAAMVRNVLPETIIVYGGVHATSMPAETLAESPACDFVILREGEQTITELIESLKTDQPDFYKIKGLAWRQDIETVAVNPDRTLLPALDDLPLGMFGDLDLSRYIPHPTQYVRLPNYPFVSQRGCPYPCTFCEANVALGKKVRLYSVERIIEELKILKYEKGARGIYFQDSTFTLNRRYVTNLFEMMIKNGLNDLLWSCTTRTDRVDPDLLQLMYEAGCRNILYGIESGNQQSLDVIKKNITVESQQQAVEWTHKAKITMTNSFILCLPGETEDMVENTINFAKSLASQVSLFYLPVPYPGSELYKICKKDGGIRENTKWSEFLSIDFDNPIYINPRIGKERMRYWYKRAYVSYYSSLKVWKANLNGLIWNGGIHRCWRGINAVRSLVTHKA